MCPVVTNEQIQEGGRKTRFEQFPVVFVVLTELFTTLRHVWINNNKQQEYLLFIYFSQSYTYIVEIWMRYKY